MYRLLITKNNELTKRMCSALKELHKASSKLNDRPNLGVLSPSWMPAYIIFCVHTCCAIYTDHKPSANHSYRRENLSRSLGSNRESRAL